MLQQSGLGRGGGTNRRLFRLLTRLILVAGILAQVEVPQPVRLVYVGLLLLVRHLLPLASQPLRDLGVVNVRLGFDDLAALVVGEHHEGVHWAFDLLCVVGGLKGRKMKMSLDCFFTGIKIYSKLVEKVRES